VIAEAMVPGDGDVVTVSDAGRGERVVAWLRGVGIGWVVVVSVLATAAVLAASLMSHTMTWANSVDEAMAVGKARHADVIAGCCGGCVSLSRVC